MAPVNDLSQTNQISLIFSTQLDDLVIHFGSSLESSTFSLYGRTIQFVWMEGYLTELDHNSLIASFEDGSRKLQIDVSEYKQKLERHDLIQDLFRVGSYISIICRITVVAIEDEAHPYLQLQRLNFSINDDPSARHIWTHKVELALTRVYLSL